MPKASAYANANIALIKYWGKSNSELNIPAVSSISLTLDNLGTSVSIKKSLVKQSILSINNQPESGPALARLLEFFMRIKLADHLSVESFSSVPIAAGLASSASFYAALTLALDKFYGWHLSPSELSRIARLGSASAARSIFSGLVALHGGQISSDQAYAFKIEASSELKLGMLIAILDRGPKKISSRQAMTITKQSSPFYSAWLSSSKTDFNAGLEALKNGSFSQLGAIMEHSCLKMHASMWAAQPSINYLSPASLAMINLIYELRAQHGPLAYFTMDAGPNVKILGQLENLKLIKEQLTSSALVAEIIESHPGPGAYLL